jgi:deoxyribodipyrimidine photo-lyase
MPASIVWFRRDLRLADNHALRKAVDCGGPVICLYIREPGDPLAGANGAAQAWWLHHSLVSLDASLKARGNRLVTLTGDPRHLIDWLVEQAGASSVFWNRRYDGAGREIDAEIKAALKVRGVRAESSPGFVLHDPTVLKTQQGRHFSVYTPFWKAFEAAYRPPDDIPAPEHISAGDLTLDSEDIDSWNLLPTGPNWASGFDSLWQPGEAGAWTLLEKFTKEGLDGYCERRDFPADTHTSRLSPHLAFGEISPHAIWRASAACADRAQSDDVTRYKKEIVWRDFAWHTLFHNPRLGGVNLDRRFDRFPWRDDDVGFDAWTRGRTGYPIVDAGMRELWATGTMHNRIRMVTASFLIKDLLIDWRRGELWFRDTLLDADMASNPFNWQWVAGCGADAAPFFRVFNPILQGEKFDPAGAYVRRWCPELGALPDKFLHRPFEAPVDILKKAGLTLDKEYPRPIVDHFKAKDAALEALKATRGGDD